MPYTESPRFVDKCSIVCICLIFILMFLSNVYQSIDTPLKMVSLILAVYCFVSTCPHSRIAFTHLAYIACIVLFLLVEFVQCEMRYGQNIAEFFSASYYFTFSLLIPVFATLASRYGTIGLLRILERVILAISVFMILCSVLRFLLGVDITGITRMRSGLIRINAPFLVQFGPCISMYLVFADEKLFRARHICTLLTSIFSLVFVYQSRLVILLTVLCLAVLLLVRYRNNTGKLYIAGICVAVILILLFNGPLAALINSFSSTDTVYGASTTTRINETSYYLALFKDNILNGVGLIPYGSPSYSIISGPLAQFFVDDVGIVGALAVIGLWIIPLFCIPIVFLGYNIIRNESFQLLGWPILIFIVGTCFTTLIVFPYFDPAWSLVMALFSKPQNSVQDCANRK